MKSSELALLFAAVWLAPLYPGWVNQFIGFAFVAVAIHRMSKGR